jgi:hypothetical protein
MKWMFIAIGLMLAMPEADAAYCHAGVYRAGCVGPRGGAVVRRRYPHYGANVCRWRAGRRVCY